MIIYDPRSYSDILLRWEGSVLPQVLLHLVGTGIVSIVATIAQAQPDINFDMPDEGHKIFGFLVGFLLVFRSTIAYNRFWNGRGFLNGLQNASMEFMRNVCMFASSEAGWVSALTPWSQPCIAAHPAPTYPQGKDPEKAEALKAKRQTFRRLITQLMLIAALKLRGTLGVPKRSSESDEGAVESPLASSTNVSGWELPAWLVIAQTHPLFTQKDVEGYTTAGGNAIFLCMRQISHEVFPLFKEKHYPHVNMLRTTVGHIKDILGIFGQCAAISDTPIPFPYVQMAKVFTIMFLYTLPFALVTELGGFTIVAVWILALGYFGLDAIATEMEDPFGLDINDLDTKELVQEIEQGSRILLEQLEKEPQMIYDIEVFFD
mmetsp:Transcript_26171/g.69678  ORF Transcript_26171/g.69678 Transcript_26171/m.69678 type:complete len:375 (+) Transcript_26171:439-1563(+)